MMVYLRSGMITECYFGTSMDCRADLRLTAASPFGAFVKWKISLSFCSKGVAVSRNTLVHTSRGAHWPAHDL